MGVLLNRFRRRCKAYYREPKWVAHNEARQEVWTELYRSYPSSRLRKHVDQIAGSLTRAELETARGQAREWLLEAEARRHAARAAKCNRT